MITRQEYVCKLRLKASSPKITRERRRQILFKIAKLEKLRCAMCGAGFHGRDHIYECEQSYELMHRRCVIKHTSNGAVRSYCRVSLKTLLTELLSKVENDLAIWNTEASL
jgi:hypothetical protein